MRWPDAGGERLERVRRNAAAEGPAAPTENGVVRPPLQRMPHAADAPSISPRSVSTPAPGTIATGTLRQTARTWSATRSTSCVIAPETKTSPPEGAGTSARAAASDRPRPSGAVTEMEKLRAAIDPAALYSRDRPIPKTIPLPGF